MTEQLNIDQEVRLIANGTDPLGFEMAAYWTPADRLMAAAASYVADDLPVPVDLLASLAGHGIELSAVIEEGRSLQNLILEIEGDF